MYAQYASLDFINLCQELKIYVYLVHQALILTYMLPKVAIYVTKIPFLSIVVRLLASHVPSIVKIIKMDLLCVNV